MSLNSHVWPSRAAQIGPPLGPGVRQLSGAGARAGVCLVLQLVHYLINGTQPFRGWLLCFIVGFLFDFFLCASSSSFCPMLPRGGAATATEHKFSYNFKQRRVLCLDHNGAFVTKLANWINRFHFVYLLVIKHLCFDFLSALRANQMNHLHFCSMLLCFFVFVDLLLLLLLLFWSFHRCFLMLNRCKS